MEIPKRYLDAGQRLAGRAESAVRRAAKPLRSYGFPYRPPNVPKGVEVPREESKLGSNYETEWARRPLARAARGATTEVAKELLTDIRAELGEVPTSAR